jgi:hypothetical protein
LKHRRNLEHVTGLSQFAVMQDVAAKVALRQPENARRLGGPPSTRLACRTTNQPCRSVQHPEAIHAKAALRPIGPGRGLRNDCGAHIHPSNEPNQSATSKAEP